jgi:uncharacterized protein (TIGR02147 family)
MKIIGPNIFKYTDYREYLTAAFKMARRRDPDFTIKGFSKYLGLRHRGHLYQMLWGKRNITTDMSLRMTKALGLRRPDTLYFEYLVMWQRAGSKLVQDEYFGRLCSLNPRLKRLEKELNDERRFARKRK